MHVSGVQGASQWSNPRHMAESPLGEVAACRYAPGLMSNSASGPEKEKFFDHHAFCIGHNLRMSPVTDHMLQSGLKFEVSAKTLTREKRKANLN